MPQNEKQVGAVFLIGGKVVGVDAFDSADTFAKAAPKLIRSYAVDALECLADSITKESTNDLVGGFLSEIAAVDLTRFKAIGLGDDLRFNGLNLAGAALEISGHVVHMVSFPRNFYEGHGEEHPRSERMTRARLRRTFH